MKMIIRSSNGDIKEQEVSENMNFTPTLGEQIYFTGVQTYTFQLMNDNDTMNVYFISNDGERINVILNDLAQLIQQNDPLDAFSVDTIFGVSTNKEGDKQIDEALNNKEFESGEIIEALKEALSLDGSTLAGGAVIDDFQSMLDNMAATAAGEELQDTAFLSAETPNQGLEADANNNTAGENPENPEENAPIPVEDTNNTPTDPEPTPDPEPDPEPTPDPEPLPVLTLQVFAQLEDGTLSSTNTITENNNDDTATTTGKYIVLAVDENGTPLVNQPIGTVTVNVTPGTANENDFNNPTSVSTALNQSFEIESRDDAIADNGETFNLDLDNGSYSNSDEYSQVNYLGDVTTTIVDATDPNNPQEEADVAYTLQIFARLEDGSLSTTNEISEANEDGTADTTATYVVLAVDADGNPLSNQPSGDVRVIVTPETATNDDFENPSAITATIGQDFEIESKDDYLADSGETFDLRLQDGTWTNDAIYEEVIYQGNVTTTIVDENADELDTVILKIVAANEDGEPIDANGDVINEDNPAEFVIVNSVDEGNASNYIAYAFVPGTTVFTYEALAVQIGSVDVAFKDNTANPVSGTDAVGADATDLANDGSEDYVNVGQKVTLGESFSTDTIDDYMSDNNETFTVSIDDVSSYAATDKNGVDISIDGIVSNGYENVVADTEVVTTTILDDTNDTSGNTDDPNTPPENEDTPPSAENPETDHEIVILKVVAANENGEPIDANGDVINEQNPSEFIIVNSVDEGNASNYIAYAFVPGTTVFTYDALAVQIGSVDVTFNDNSANPVSGTDAVGADATDLVNDGSEDYVNVGQKVTLGEFFSTDTIDDYLSDTGETFTVSIATGTYAATDKDGVDITINGSISNGYENVTVDDKVVTTTILDDDAITATDDTNIATEIGDEFRPNEDAEDTIDGKDDGQSASGNIITDTTADEASNTNLTLSITEVKFGSTDYTLPTDGSDLVIEGDYGTLTINNTGTYSYDVNESLTDSWNVGKNEVDSFTYTLTDGYNTDTADLNITVEGRDDAPEITSITANDRATHTIGGVVDLDGDGSIDTITPDDLINNNGNPTFTSDNGNFILDMGTESSSMSVEYHGGNAGYQNIVGFYEKDASGNITDVKIIYADDVSGFDSTYANLGTLNDLNDEVGFFIIPNGYNNADIKSIIDGGNYDVSIGGDNKVTLSTDSVTTTANTVYYTDNDMNTDKQDHVIVGKNDDGSLTIGFEDLSLGDQDYDDVVLTIKPCLTLEDMGGAIIRDINLSDIDDTNLESAEIVLKNYHSGDIIDTNGLPLGITILSNSEVNGELVVKLTGSATIAEYEAAIESLTFDTSSTDREVRTFEYTVFDGDKHSNTMPVSLDIGGCEINNIHTPDVHVQISQNDITMEGNSLSHTVSLVYADGTPFIVPNGETITVNLTYEDHNYNKNQNWDTNTDRGDFDHLTTQVTITGGNSSVTFENDTAYNTGKEQDESYTVTVASIDDSATDTNGDDVLLKETTFVIDETSATGEIVDIDQTGKEDNDNRQEGVGHGGDWDINLVSGDLTQVYTDDNVQSITISGIPDDAVVKDANGDQVTVNSGVIIITSLTDAEALTITPALDSSTDIKLSYEVTLDDNTSENFSQTIRITPEADQPWTLDALGYEEKTYDAILEDSGFMNLGLTDADASTGETGVGHLSETNTVVRFFSDSETNLPNGTQVQYENSNGQTKTFTFDSSHTYVDVPADKLSSVEFKAPADFNGEINIKMKTGVTDLDEDYTTDKGWNSDEGWTENGSADTTWGIADKLTFKITGDVDLSEDLFVATSVEGLEDAGRDQQTGDLTENSDGTYDITGAIDLEIKFNADEYTDTEILEFEIQNIPAGTLIFDANGNMLNSATDDTVKIVYDPSDSYAVQAGEVEFTDLAQYQTFIENLKLVPTHDSNVDFDLTLEQTATEPNYDSTVVGGTESQTTTDTVRVQLTGVADDAVVSGTETPIELVESGSWQDIPGFTIASGEEQHLSEEVYALLQNVPNDIGLRIIDSSGTEIFDALVLAKVNSDSTDWRIDGDTLDKIDDGTYTIQLKTPDANMSGELSFDVKVTVLDIDSDAGQVTDTSVSDHTINFSVKPSVENYGGSSASGNEDEWIALNLTVQSKDGDTLVEDAYTLNGTDYDLKIKIPNLGETFENVQVDGDNLTIDGGFIYLNQEDLASVKILAPLHSNEDIAGIKLYRTLQDDMDDNSTSDVDQKEVVTTHSVHVTGVADGWEDVDNTDNGTTDEFTDTDYDGFVITNGTVDSSTNNVSLSALITNNINIEDAYHDTVTGTDNSESEYYIVSNTSSDNTTWMIDGGINVGNGTWLVTSSSLDDANIKVVDSGGDGSLDLKITPVSKENDGDVLFDQEHKFTVNYTIGTGGTGSTEYPAITLGTNTDGTEDITLTNIFSGTSATLGATLSYVVHDLANIQGGSIDTSNMYELPDGSFVFVGDISFIPDANFNGDVNLIVDVIATTDDGRETRLENQSITLDIDPVLDDITISADDNTEVDTNGTIDLNLEVKSKDTDGSETINGDVIITLPTDTNNNPIGSLTGTDITDNNDGTYTIDASNLDSISFVPPEYTHGNFEFGIKYTVTDEDLGSVDESDISEERTGTFTINLASQVDDIEITLTPNDTVNETVNHELNLNLNQHDDDGSEIASVSVSGIPTALVIVNSNDEQIGNYKSNGDGTVTVVLTGDEVIAGGLELFDTTGTFGGTFTLNIEAFSLDKITKEISTGSEDNVSLTITPVASAIESVDAGSAQEDKVIGDEDNTGMALDLDVIMTDLDGSEKLQVTFDNSTSTNGLPDGFTVVYGDNNTPVTETTYLTAEEAQTIKIVPPADYNGEFDLNINVKTVDFNTDGTVSDILDTAVVETVHVKVNAVNDAPEANDDGTFSKTIAEDTALVISASELLANDIDVDGDTLHISAVQANAGTNGTVTLNSDGNIVYIPEENFYGDVSFTYTYTVSDGELTDTATATVDLTVSSVNDLPVINVNSTQTVAENGSINIAYNTSDIEDTAEIIPTATATNGTALVNNDGTITFTPDPDYIGTATVTVTAEDSDGGITTKNITVTVNDNPDAIDDTLTPATAEDTTLVISASDLLGNDIDTIGNSLSISSVTLTGDTHGTVSINGAGNVVYIPDANYNGPVSFEYTVTDGTLTDTAIANLTVSAVNDAPVITVDNTQSVNEDGSVNITYSASDAEDGTITSSVTKVDAQTQNGTATIDGNGTITYTPNADFSGTDTIRLTVTDNEGETTTKDIAVTINAVADTPDLEDNDLTLSNEIESAGMFTYDVGISASTTDTDGSESITLFTIDGIPAGSELTYVDDSYVKQNITITGDSAELTPEQLSGLKISTPTQLTSDGADGLNITVTATSTDDTDTATKTATLIDGIVEGAQYETSSGIKGLTDENGNFSYREGDSVTFSVGAVVLGVVTSEDIASGQIFLQHIADVELTNVNDEYLENLATFLQSIDSDVGDNIVITAETRAALVDSYIDLKTASEEEVQDFVENIGVSYVDEDTAMEHVQDMLEQYAGIDASEFDERVSDTVSSDDTIKTATFGMGAIAGVAYITSSGIEGVTDENGLFSFEIGDIISFKNAEGEIIAELDSSTIGDDSLITLGELDITVDDLNTPIEETVETVASEESQVETEEKSEENEESETSETEEEPRENTEVNDLLDDESIDLSEIEKTEETIETIPSEVEFEDIIPEEDDDIVIQTQEGEELVIEKGEEAAATEEEWKEVANDKEIEGQDGTFTEYTTGTTNPTITVFVDNEVDTGGL